jgi:hypothetical protein
MLKDPDTGRRVSRLNPRTEWQTIAVPDLAIVDRATFDAAQARLAERAGIAPERQRRPRHLLSGLLRCASCGGGMSTFGADRSGRKRLRCTRTYESGDCPDPQTFYLETVERTVLEARAPSSATPASSRNMCGPIKTSAHASPVSSAAIGLRKSAAPASCAAKSTA